MKKIFTLSVSFLVLISTVTWALEDSYASDIEREPAIYESEYEFKFECWCCPEVDGAEPGVRIKVEVDEEWTLYEIASEFVTVEELFKNLTWKEPVCFVSVKIGVGLGGKVEEEVDLEEIKNIAVAIAKRAPGLDADGDGQLTIHDVRLAIDEDGGADRAVHVIELKRPTPPPGDEDQRDEAR